VERVAVGATMTATETVVSGALVTFTVFVIVAAWLPKR
jgi:hypothetical protein